MYFSVVTVLSLRFTLHRQVARMAFAEIEIGQKYHRHIIGKSGANSKYS